MQQRIPVWFLFFLLFILPETASAQTRFFQRGDSGFTGSWGTFSEINNLGDHDTGYRATYTYKGLIDFGIGIGFESNNTNFDEATKGLYGKVVLIRAREGTDIGLEAMGQYSTKTTDLNYNDPRFENYDDQNIQTGVRGFYNHPFGAKSGMIIGVSFRYRFNKHRIMDKYDEVTFGHDYGEFGFGCDFKFLLWGIVHASLGLDYEQDNSFGEQWESGGFFSLGVLIGRKPTQEAGSS